MVHQKHILLSSLCNLYGVQPLISIHFSYSLLYPTSHDEVTKAEDKYNFIATLVYLRWLNRDRLQQSSAHTVNANSVARRTQERTRNHSTG